MQQERFQVLAGTMRFRKGLSTVVARTGKEVVVEPGSYHRFANAGTEPAVVRVQVRPALSTVRCWRGLGPVPSWLGRWGPPPRRSAGRWPPGGKAGGHRRQRAYTVRSASVGARRAALTAG